MTSRQLLSTHTSGHWLLALCLPLAVAGLGNAGCAKAAEPSNPIVQTDQGSVRGSSQPSIEMFLGIPYAAPPVGKLRFAPPQPPAPHSGVLDATKYGDACPQPSSAFSVPEKYTSESCLYLNVYTPGTSSRHAVMVWIHGGAFVLGAGSQYNPAPLVRKGVVVVTINYRLGLFGFLANPALTAASKAHASGNYALMDQVAALRWVKANIARFGGDPGNVTIFGQSAGGMSVMAHLVNPNVRDLFQKAIVQSGSFNLVQPTLVEAEAIGTKVAGALGCTGSDPEVLECLRGLPVAKVVGLETAGVTKIGTNVGANLRPDDFPETVAAALQAGRLNHVPVILGGTKQEGRFSVAINLARGAMKPLTPQTYVAGIQSALHVSASTASRIAAEYPPDVYGNADYAYATVVTDSGGICNEPEELGSMSKFAPAYGYEFADEHAPVLPLSSMPFPVPQDFQYGAGHLAELQSLFARPPWFSGTPRSAIFMPSQLKLANAMVDYWTNFAKTGDPNSPVAAALTWPKFTARSQNFLQLVPPEPRVITNFASEHKCSFWAQQGRVGAPATGMKSGMKRQKD